MKLMNLLAALASVFALPPAAGSAQTLTPHPIHLADGKTFSLNLPSAFTIDVVLQGLHRVRFMAKSPDDRIFVTDMYALADNTKGAVYILDGWDARTHTYLRTLPYLTGLRNPNNVAFYTDTAGQSWLYLPLTDKLVRYKYTAGDMHPTSDPEVLATYPDYGLNYKYGGWHLTRTVALAQLHGATKLYVAVGSSCNACREKEEIRATLSVMDPDGKNSHILARGLRNAVGLVTVPSIDGGALFATNMGADHLGDAAPEDTFFELDSTQHPAASTTNYGWPTCYFENGSPHPDPLISAPKSSDHTVPAPPAGLPPVQFDCSKIPPPYTTFISHSSPLGVAFFGADSAALRNTFLVALHGAGKPRIGTGYRVVKFSPDGRHATDFITGFFLRTRGKPVIYGRPCGLLALAPDTFLLTDDHDGTIYLVHPR